MCVIIYKPKGVIADKELLEIKFKSNNDSWGIVLNGVVEKGTGDFNEFWQNVRQRPYEMLIHFRTGTSGKDKSIGVQPLRTRNYWFFLNGNLSGYFGKDEPDTVLYARDYLDKLPDDFLENKEIRKKIEEDCLANNAVMAFMNCEGKVFILNESRGVWEKGVWFSNPRVGNYAGFGYSGVYSYKESEKRYNI
jgi:hypothetical protein